MAKISADALAMASNWMVFGERLGWVLLECDEGKAKFHTKQLAKPFTILIQVREDIERTWSEQDKSDIKIEGNVIKAASNA